MTLFHSEVEYSNTNLVIITQLKGQCHEIFDHFFCFKGSTWTLYEQMKTVREFLGFREDIREKRVSALSTTMLTPVSA